MLDSYIALTCELIIGFFALLVLTKVLGKNQITQLTPFDFISALVLGELVGNAIYDEDIGLHYVLYAVFIWGMLIYAIEMLTQKFRATRAVLEGSPSVIIAKGRIQFKELKKNKLDLNQLQHLLRERGVFSIQEVEYGILETNGSVNVQRKSAYDIPTNKDLAIHRSDPTLPIPIIMDGEIIEESLTEMNQSKTWLQEILLKRGIATHKAVLYAEWIEGNPLFLQTYKEER
ncbi:DUF421 domain-containing protein [Shouchella lonarensis]|uniref:Uncharacterized membrane protein YcaP, DUF421 family n=1 Tax=Shouchella lonarensis TaxID=1464122 RepID=A0A1G6LEE5_9BACI|nr:DUF421 domain-containing protein [Shouchella lonarensis]SDC40956.1 Uncharacterized membrane protein YcaP, DUF421 family [Shouchella lonarensis]